MQSPAARHVRTAVQGRLGRITLNRPGKINALTVEMIGAVRSALDAFAGDDAVSAVLIDGAGDRGSRGRIRAGAAVARAGPETS